MTQVKEMTNQELNRALAELIGYTVKKYKMPPDPGGYNWSLDYYKLIDSKGAAVETSLETEEEAWSEAPDYCTDPAASLEVQTAACKHNFTLYVNALSDIAASDAHWEDGRMDHEGISKLFNAKPRERAEAAYITLSQVRER